MVAKEGRVRGIPSCTRHKNNSSYSFASSNKSSSSNNSSDNGSSSSSSSLIYLVDKQMKLRHEGVETLRLLYRSSICINNTSTAMLGQCRTLTTETEFLTEVEMMVPGVGAAEQSTQ